MPQTTDKTNAQKLRKLKKDIEKLDAKIDSSIDFLKELEKLDAKLETIELSRKLLEKHLIRELQAYRGVTI